MKGYVVRNTAKPAFQSRMKLKLFETVRIFREDSGSEDLIAYWAIEDAHAHHRQYTNRLSRVTIANVKFQATILPENRLYCIFMQLHKWQVIA